MLVAIALTAGGLHACALRSGGLAVCWGRNGTTRDRPSPTVISLIDDGTEISSAAHTTCVRRPDESIWCWGFGAMGQLGDGTTTDRIAPVDVSGLRGGVTAIAAGALQSCALKSTGGVKCWGNTSALRPVDVSGLSGGVIAIAAGATHSCALTRIGGVKCWGRNNHGQLGDGTTADRLAPVEVSSLRVRVTAIAAGTAHSCALTSTGRVTCWGTNRFGQLGDGTTSDRRRPVDVSGLSGGATAIAAGSFHSCALTRAGGIRCWGANTSGQLGDGTKVDRRRPVRVVGFGPTRR